MTLAKIMMITGENPVKQNEFIDKIIFHCQRGIKLIQLRAKNLNSSEYHSLAKKVITATQNYDTKIILNCDYASFYELGGDGIHLSSHMLMAAKTRPLPNEVRVSAACHDLKQLMKAQEIDIDFVTLSPVLQTKTHPEAEPLGWEQFAALCRSVTIPVYALGGISSTHLELAISAGAYGYAAIGSLWDSD